VTSSVLPTWIQWTLGAVAAEAYCGTIRLPWFCRSLWAVPLWAVAAEMYHPLYLALYGMAFFTLINWCVAWETCHRRPVRGTMRAVAGIGTMSYSLYLVHVPVQDVMMGVSSRIGAFDTPAMYLFRVTVLVAASLAVARALFVLVESRFLFAGRPSSIPDQDCPSVSRGPVRAKVECRRGIQ
jgi:peptidoglycan/LPS O-acetylase OafA/YrhL